MPGREGFAAFFTAGRGFAMRQRRGHIANQLLFRAFFSSSARRSNKWVPSNGSLKESSAKSNEIGSGRAWLLDTEMVAPTYTAPVQRFNLCISEVGVFLNSCFWSQAIVSQVLTFAEGVVSAAPYARKKAKECSESTKPQ